METIIVYVLKVNIAVVLFYLLYKLLFIKDTFFVARRSYLIGAILFSFIYPLLPVAQLGTFFDFMKRAKEVQATVSFDVASMGSAVLLDETGDALSLNWLVLLKIAVAFITVLFAIKVLWQLVLIMRIKKNSRQQMLHDIRYQHLPSKSTPFSFFKWIFIYPEAHSSEKLKQILTHEQVHVEQWHSIDITLMEFLVPLFWYNPFFWLLRKEVSINIEFLADQGVLSKGFNRREYQYHILHLTYPRNNIQIVNNFNVSQLKQRIMMMNNEKTPMKKLIKYVLVLPVALLLISANSVHAQKKEPQKAETKSSTLIIRDGNDTIKENPLIIIDDEIMDKDYDMKNISPNDIESISVLKGESGIEMYGDEGKNGVIIITTKKMNLQATSNNNQSKSHNGDEVFITVDQMPLFPGGNEAMFKFLAENIKYPVTAQENGIQGRVICNFVVKKDGSIEDVQVVRGVDPGLDKEAVRIIKMMPNWEPARNKGEKVNVEFTLPVVFRLQGGESKSSDITKSPIKEDKQIDAKMENIIDEIVVVGYGQSKSNDSKNELFIVVEEQPQFPGGTEAMMTFLSEHVKYPDIAKENGIQGSVIVNFVIERDGSISEVGLTRGVDPSLDTEAVRVIKSMPDWQPGKQRGKAVRVRFTLPIDFKLPDNNETE